MHTPAGEVQVLGTCFRVRVEQGEEQVKSRDWKVGTLGAALGVATFVSVYEGKVSLSQPSQPSAGITLAAGETARADGRGVARAGSVREGAVADAEGRDDPLLVANANLADSVQAYKRRIEAVEAQKASLEKSLAETQTKLASSQREAGQGPERSAYDLSTDDWKQLAQDGTVKARYPCMRTKPDGDDMSKLEQLGLPASDGPVLQKALTTARARIWTMVRPLCASALGGDFAAADKIGVATCEGVVRQVAEANGVDVGADMQQVAEIRAGIRPSPSDGGDAVVKIMLELTSESSAVEQELAQQIGPEDAKRLVYGDGAPGCWNSSIWTNKSEPKLP